MRSPWRIYGMLALLCVVPLVAVAQDYSAEPRGEIQVVNDGKKPARITLWITGGEQLRPRRWTLGPRQSEFLGNAAGKRIKVRGSDRISLSKGEQVEVAQVGQFQGGIWYVSIREMRRATRPHPGLPPDQENALPPDSETGLPPDTRPEVPFGAPPAAPSERQRY